MSFDFSNDIREILIRDLNTLKQEVISTEPHFLWQSAPGIINSVGTLALHLCGNIRHFIGSVLGKDGYIRDREAEFSQKNLSKEELILNIEQTIDAVQSVLSKLTEDQLHLAMPDTPPQHKGRSTGFFLIQLSCHLSRHSGQLNYLRRIQTSVS